MDNISYYKDDYPSQNNNRVKKDEPERLEFLRAR